MRGSDVRSGRLFSYVDLEERVPARYPLLAIRVIVNDALTALSGEFQAIYSDIGRLSPEKLLRTLLLQVFYGIRSERQMMERLDFDLSFRWFVGLGIDDRVWDASSFSKNRDRLLDGDIAAQFLAAILARPRVKGLLSTDHFSVDGTLIEAWSSMKSFRPKGEAGGRRTSQADAMRRWTFGARNARTRRMLRRRTLRAVVSQEPRHGREALLHGACADGESQWACRRCRDDPSVR